MKSNYFFYIGFVGVMMHSLAVQSQSGKTDSIIHPSPQRLAPLAGTVDLINVKSNFNPVLQSVEIEDLSNAINTDSPKTMLPRLQENYQEDRPWGYAENKLSTAVTPTVISAFNGFSDNAYTPPDDNIAVSNGGYVVSVTNSIYRIFKPNSTTQYKSSNFSDALKGTLPSITGVYYDPRVIYDAEADRFIIVVLNGITSSSSEIVILFSKDNNPTDGWNAYAVSGDIFGNSEWADYPTIGISKSDLFITDNLFDDNQNYIEPSILQISKSTGYSGASNIAYRSWEPNPNIGLQPVMFTLAPASQGLGGDYGDSMYLVSNKFQGGTTLTLIKIAGNEGNSGASLTKSTVTYKSLTVASPSATGGSQKSSTYTLNEGDTRVKQAFFLNGTVHFVFATKDQVNGFTDIVYARLNPSTKNIAYKQLGAVGYDYVYPSLASFASGAQSPAVLIGYCKAGKTIFPELDAVQCDSTFTYSSSVNIITGKSAVTGNTTQQRWGDYTGLARQYNSSNCYFSGSYGIGSAYQTEIAEIGPQTLGIASLSAQPGMPVSVFPNPVSDVFNVKFDLEQKSHIAIAINDMQGRQVALLFDGVALGGDQTFSFNKNALAPGLYLLSITNGSTMLVNKKIVVNGR